METNNNKVPRPQGPSPNNINDDLRNRYRNIRRDYRSVTNRRSHQPTNDARTKPRHTRQSKNDGVSELDKSLEDLFSYSFQSDSWPQPITRLKRLPFSWHKKVFKRFPTLKDKRILGAVIISLLLISFFTIMFADEPDKATYSPQRSSSNAADIPFSDMNFTVYSPTFIPHGLTLNRSSVTQTKDSLTFNLSQDGEVRFFVQEQAVEEGFKLSEFKKKLITPTDFSTYLGQGVIGGLGSGLITALQTNDDTLIIVNCVNTVCASSSKKLIENMQLATSWSQFYNSAF